MTIFADKLGVREQLRPIISGLVDHCCIPSNTVTPAYKPAGGGAHIVLKTTFKEGLWRIQDALEKDQSASTPKFIPLKQEGALHRLQISFSDINTFVSDFGHFADKCPITGGAKNEENAENTHITP